MNKSKALYAIPDIAIKRMHKENNLGEDLGFYQDRYRIITSMAFRRLEYKTQVFINNAGDHYRTRLTHTLEVAQIAKIISNKLCLNEDLAELIALAHDLGHPPFGHAGEYALQSVMKGYNDTFDHNLHAVKLVCNIEQFTSSFKGLNLCLETIDGIIKHNGPISDCDLEKRISQVVEISLFDLKLNPSLEAQVAAVADDIAYSTHDIDDGLRAKHFELEDLKMIDWIYDIMIEINQEVDYKDSLFSKLLTERIRSQLIKDIINNTRDNIYKMEIHSVDSVKHCKHSISTFSPIMEENLRTLKDFLMKKVYRHCEVNKINLKSAKILTDLFNIFIMSPECLPEAWQAKIKNGEQSHHQVVCDYIAGMTDRYAMEEYASFF